MILCCMQPALAQFESDEQFEQQAAERMGVKFQQPVKKTATKRTTSSVKQSAKQPTTFGPSYGYGKAQSVADVDGRRHTATATAKAQSVADVDGRRHTTITTTRAVTRCPKDFPKFVPLGGTPLQSLEWLRQILYQACHRELRYLRNHLSSLPQPPLSPVAKVTPRT